MYVFIKGIKAYNKVLILVEKCPEYQKIYYGDHERTLYNKRTNSWNKTYLNSA